MWFGAGAAGRKVSCARMTSRAHVPLSRRQPGTQSEDQERALGISHRSHWCDVLRTALILRLRVRSRVGPASGPSKSLHAWHRGPSLDRCDLRAFSVFWLHRAAGGIDPTPNKAVKRGRRDSSWRAEGPGRKGRKKKEEGKSGLGDGQELTGLGK